jgi:hypothetical protein
LRKLVEPGKSSSMQFVMVMGEESDRKAKKDRQTVENQLTACL